VAPRLDHVGTEVGQQARCLRSGDVHATVEHAHAGQWTVVVEGQHQRASA
jgi:hypothetical protein